MNIINWQKFNESIAEEFDKKMATEIIFYFDENSTPTDELAEEFYDIFTDDEFAYYDISYEGLKAYTEKLLNICNQDSDIKMKMIQLYKKIREEREDFPTFWEIEECTDEFMDMQGFSLFVSSSKVSYVIKIGFNERITIDEFCKWCKYSEVVAKKLRGPTYTSKLDSCKYYDGPYYKEFKITLIKN